MTYHALKQDMEKDGLIRKMSLAVTKIAEGRLSAYIDGEEHNGKIIHDEGVYEASAVYKKSLEDSRLDLIIMSEYIYLKTEQMYGEDDEKGASNSAFSALQQLDDALLALQVVEQPVMMYKGVDLAMPRCGKQWRNGTLPRDAFIVACDSNITRIRNGLTRYGVNRLERDFAELRIGIFRQAKIQYMKRQAETLGKTG